MKKIIIITIIALNFAGCANYLDNYYDLENKEKINIPLSERFLYVKEESNIWHYLNMNIIYKDEGNRDKWQSLEYSFKTGFGDCEDFCIAFADILKRKFNKECEIVLIDLHTAVSTGLHYDGLEKRNINKRKIEEGGNINHAMVRVGGFIVDPQDGEIYNATVSFSYSINWV